MVVPLRTNDPPCDGRERRPPSSRRRPAPSHLLQGCRWRYGGVDQVPMAAPRAPAHLPQGWRWLQEGADPASIVGTRDPAKDAPDGLERIVISYSKAEWPEPMAAAGPTVFPESTANTERGPDRGVLRPAGGGANRHAPLLRSIHVAPRPSRQCGNCLIGIAHPSRRHSYCQSCFQQAGEHPDRTRSTGRKRDPAQLGPAQPSGPVRSNSAVPTSNYSSNGRQRLPRGGVLGGIAGRAVRKPTTSTGPGHCSSAAPASTHASGGRRCLSRGRGKQGAASARPGPKSARRRAERQAGMTIDVPWGPRVRCPIGDCSFYARGDKGTASIDTHLRSSHVVLNCPMPACTFTAMGADRCDDFATHTRSHGTNRVRLTATDMRLLPTTNPGKSYLCPWISTFYALLKSPPYAKAVITACSVMTESLHGLRAMGLFRDPSTNKTGRVVMDHIYHPMARPLADHLLNVLGAQDGDVVSSQDLFNLIGAYLPERQGVQDHFAVIYADI